MYTTAKDMCGYNKRALQCGLTGVSEEDTQKVCLKKYPEKQLQFSKSDEK